MDSRNVIVYLPVQFLDPHPQNPRRDLGDLTELAASIKAVGVLQNLLVVPMGERWRVVAGHRRLAASKIAGLSVVPCVIREMSEAEQLRTMLAENMQRSDLTVLEQADGIQLMLDLGDTVAQIADGTGLSETTVRRRMKLLELPREPLAESLERGGRLEDYLALDKLKKPENREKVLRAVGTANFANVLTIAENEELREAKQEKLQAWLDTWATQADGQEELTVANGYRYTMYYTVWTAERKKPEAGEIEYVYEPDGYGGYRVYAVVPEDERPKDTGDAEWAQSKSEYEQRKARFAALQSAFEEGEALRLRYVTRMDEDTASIPEVFAACAAKLAAAMVDHMIDPDPEKLLAALGEPDEDDKYDEDDERDQANLRRIAEIAREQPHRAVLAAAYCAAENDAGQPYSFDKYCGSDSYSEFLRWMQEALGYPVSIEERQLEDGSHPLYKEGEAE